MLKLYLTGNIWLMSILQGLVVLRNFNLTSYASSAKFVTCSPLFHYVYSNFGSCNVLFQIQIHGAKKGLCNTYKTT